jgi:hypothetical protein
MRSMDVRSSQPPPLTAASAPAKTERRDEKEERRQREPCRDGVSASPPVTWTGLAPSCTVEQVMQLQGLEGSSWGNRGAA